LPVKKFKINKFPLGMGNSVRLIMNSKPEEEPKGQFMSLSFKSTLTRPDFCLLKANLAQDKTLPYRTRVC
jgi:hypothetical protein